MTERKKINVPIYAVLASEPNKRILARIVERITTDGIHEYIAELENGNRYPCTLPYQRGEKHGKIIINGATC